MVFYSTNPSPDLLQQGDVLENIPFFVIPQLPLLIARKVGGETIDQDIQQAEITSYEDPSRLIDEGLVNESAVVDLEMGRVMIVSQTCDIPLRDNVAVCKVFSVEEYREKSIEVYMERRVDVDRDIASRKADEHIESNLRKWRINYLFYLPAHNTTEELISDFQNINTIRIEFLKIENRAASLSPMARHMLANHLGQFLSRPAVPKFA